MIAPCFYVTKKGVMPAKNFCPRSHGFRGALCKGEIKCRLQRKAERSGANRKDMVLYFAFTGAAHRNILKLRGQKN